MDRLKPRSVTETGMLSLRSRTGRLRAPPIVAIDDIDADFAKLVFCSHSASLCTIIGARDALESRELTIGLGDRAGGLRLRVAECTRS